MKKLPILIFIITLLINWQAYAGQEPVRESATKNGVKFWIMEDHYMPIVSIRLAFSRSGFAYDPAGKLGLSYMVASLLDEGAGDMSSLEFSQKLEELATDISFETDQDNFYISLKTLSSNLADAMQLMGLAMSKPRFDEKAVERIRGQIQVVITKQQEDPEALASLKFNELIFEGHPYGRVQYGKSEDVAKISKADLQNFVKDHFTHENMVVSVVGDVTADKISAMLDKNINLPQKANLPAVLAAPVINKTKREDISKSIPQTAVMFGLKAPQRNDPDFYPAYLMNYILGGGSFESRLMQEIREKNGLVYTVYSYIDNAHSSGILAGYLGTKNSNSDKAIELLKQQIKKMKEGGITESELQAAKDYLIGSFPLKMTKNSNLAAFLSVMQTESLGIDFFEKRNSYVENVTVEQVNAVASRLLNDDDMVIVTVGGSHKAK